jgi:hypothetical protein
MRNNAATAWPAADRSSVANNVGAAIAQIVQRLPDQSAIVIANNRRMLRTSLRRI